MFRLALISSRLTIIPPNTPIQPRLPIILDNQVRSSLVSPNPPPIQPSYDRSFVHLAAKWLPTSLIGRPFILNDSTTPARFFFTVGDYNSSAIVFHPLDLQLARIDYNRSPIVFHPRKSFSAESTITDRRSFSTPSRIDARPSFSTPARIDDNSSAIVFHPREPRKKLADQPFWNRPIHLNRASKKARRPFWNRPIHLNRAHKTDCRPFWNRPIQSKRSINDDHQLFSNQTASPTAPQDLINNIQIRRCDQQYQSILTPSQSPH
ncbi:hypothetical protein PGTUg99_026731 [Puccinia graminis f. sp. tritici]|uniref:Uncharacterized protein n=1 Tax=Puccinia graminis f. sp. tritici TaxID=56615 RepID=A0A5B0P1B3_PUCGR|nr:hypothetical protein PGTUg99_026731 [Puccinia graminis f. sp. tritici]